MKSGFGQRLSRWLPRIVLLVLALLTISQPTLNFPAEAVQRGAYRESLAAHPGDSAILEHWLQASIAAHQIEQAVALIRQLATLNGWTADRRRQLADLIAQTDSTQAAVYWRTLLDGSAHDISLLHRIIVVELSARNWSDAAVMLNRLVALDPADANALYQLALLTLPTDPKAAISYLGRAAADPALHSRALAVSRLLDAHAADTVAMQVTQIGLQLIGEEQWPFAEYLLNRAIMLNGGRPAALALLGVTQDQQGRDGWPMIQQAAARTPDDPAVDYAVALHWRLVGDLDAALVALQRAEARNPTNPALAAEIGTVYRQRGRFDEAVLWFNLAVRLAPQEVGFQQVLATFYVDERYRLDGDGLTAIQKAVQAFPNDVEIRASLGQALLAVGQTEQAHTELQHALTLDPSNIRARYYFGATLEQQGDPGGAQAAYLYVARNAPSGTLREQAWRSLERLGYHS